MSSPIPLHSIPALNASLNGACTVFLLAGLYFIRRGKIAWHRASMITALVFSAAFLGFYLYYHFNAGIVRFGGHGWIRPVYFALLIPHTILAIVNLPLILVTLSFALRRRFGSHRALARWAYPIWLYVSVTGVIIYLLLYRVYTPIYPS
ncbi:MAG TPA: DUF420 domain-containing protein [Verrucomicrobiae bacterium]|nr:DUF420 domain-containing protein [Verrucomicrobiae bacterium]